MKRTRTGKKTAVGDVESKLKRRYPGNPKAVYGTLNKIGLMRGSKTTAKGRKAAASKSNGKMRSMRRPKRMPLGRM